MTKIAACLIVKDSAEIISKCLDSIRPYVDEINIYDTGSTDGTLELLEKLSKQKSLLFQEGEMVCPSKYEPGDPEAKLAEDQVLVPLAPIRVERGEWREDFGWAREQSFAMVSDDVGWFLWLDDDDVIVGAENLRQMVALAQPDLDGFVMFYDYARDESGTCVCQLWRERLLRRSSGFYWKNPVHEVLVPPEDTAPTMQFVPPQVIRYIHDRPAERYDAGRNLAILLREKEKAEAEGRPIEPRTLAYLGTEHMAKMNWGEAALYLNAYVERPDARWGDERAQVHHKLATCLRFLDNPLGSIEVEIAAVKERHDWAENYVGLAQSYSMLGNWSAALHYAQEAQKFGMPQSSLILNPLEFSLVPLLVEAEALAQLGQAEEARRAIAKLVQIFPAYEMAQAKAADLDRMLAENDIVNAVLTLREVLVRHDENAKAWQLMESVPYLVAERPEIVMARAEQREMVAHLRQPEEYRRWYVDEPKESTVADELVEKVDECIERAAYLVEGLEAQEKELGRKPRVLDLGCNDYWLECFLWKRLGLKADGVELNRQAYEKGLERKRTFGAPGRLVHGDLYDAPKFFKRHHYDAVILFEVFEHLPDPESALEVMREMLAPGGRIYLTTPNGAFERGQIEAWAKVERKGHLHAFPASTLIEMLIARGEIKDFRVHAGGRLAYASYTPGKRKGKVILYDGPGWEEWSPESVNKGGLGGSETAMIYLAVGLAQAGYEVKVYAGAVPGFYAGSLWRPVGAFDPSEECDLLVVSRRAIIFDLPLAAKRKVLWCHDHSYPGQLTEKRIENMDALVVLSEWQRARFERLYPTTKDKLVIRRNGIALEALGEPKFAKADKPWSEREPRCIYSSSADRGLDVLLGIWPMIREQVPEAELHIFYGWKTYDAVAKINPALYAYKAKVLELLEAAGGEAGGVFMRGRLGQAELAAEMQEARVLAYPTAFLETSCISAMEAKAAGLPIVTSDLGALHETAAGQTLIPWVWDEADRALALEGFDAIESAPVNKTAGYQAEFIASVVQLLTNEGVWNDLHGRALDGATENAWEKRIPGWEALVRPLTKPATDRSRRHLRVAV